MYDEWVNERTNELFQRNIMDDELAYEEFWLNFDALFSFQVLQACWGNFAYCAFDENRTRMASTRKKKIQKLSQRNYGNNHWRQLRVYVCVCWSLRVFSVRLPFYDCPNYITNVNVPTFFRVCAIIFFAAFLFAPNKVKKSTSSTSIGKRVKKTGCY